ncbi:MAG: polyprenyl synthetase family protein [Propionibacteriaceae bacterium]|nr:polyprenyl synthetase family protein [Propionibacteriaceae bacterium]
MLLPSSDDPLSPELVREVGSAVSAFLDEKAPLVEQVGSLPVLEVARAYCSGGKRLRPAFCYWGYVAAAGHPADPGPLIRAAASLDVLHASLVVHDDLIDRSDTRRGEPAAHRQYEDLHARVHGTGSHEDFGAAAAVLLGDALLAWSAELYESSGLPAADLGRARPLLQEMRSEVLLGQYLDVAAAYQTTRAAAEQTQAERVLEYKSARYSVRRPLEIGALLGGAEPEGPVLAALGRFGSLLGGAFQLRDDVLGIFGDPSVTGKPAGDDLREGKRTLLVLEALARADERQRTVLDSVIGDRSPTSASLAEARTIIASTGALDVIEQHINERAQGALTALDGVALRDDAHAALVGLAERSIRRER